MKKYILFSILTIYGIFRDSLISQVMPPMRPKIGLCLSGGAAKGIAHISLLKALDSLDIKVDYITGTSMGSIMGALYAIGYSGKEIEQIILNISWEKLLTNSVSLNDINIEEKDEYGRYPIELPFRSGTIQLPSGVIEGQYLMTMLQRYTFRTLSTKDFKQFPIPFKCIGADIVKGEAVVLDTGNLALALRASMAIPTVFTPVEMGELLLIDGGMVKNFPVDKVKEMGADYVIGSYTGGALFGRQSMNSFIKIMYQTASFSRLADAEVQKKNCQILVDFEKVLSEIRAGVGDFRKTKDILRVADKAMAEMMPQLEALAREQKSMEAIAFKVTPQSFKENNAAKWLLPKADSIQADRIEILEIDAKTGESIEIKNQYKIDNHSVSCREIEEKVSDLYGTNQYAKIFYTLEKADTDHVIKIRAVTLPKSVFKVGLHHDSELGTGITVNMTLRDRLGDFSRAYMALDISEKPKVRIDYLKRFGWSAYWIKFNSYYEHVSSALYFDNKNLEDYRRLFFTNYLSINRRFGKEDNLSVGFFYERVKFQPRVAATNRALLSNNNDTLIQLALYKYNLSGLQLQYQYNTLDARYFPTKGAAFNFTARLPLSARRYSDLTFVANEKIVHTFHQDDRPTQQYLITVATAQLVRPLGKHMQLIGDLAAGKYFNVETIPADSELALLFGIGGVEPRNGHQLIPFWGYRENFSLHSALVTGRLGLQMNPYERFYIIPALSFLMGDGFNVNKNSDVKTDNIITSWGITAGMKTPLGPIQFNVSKADNTENPKFYFSLGIRF